MLRNLLGFWLVEFGWLGFVFFCVFFGLVDVGWGLSYYWQDRIFLYRVQKSMADYTVPRGLHFGALGFGVFPWPGSVFKCALVARKGIWKLFLMFLLVNWLLKVLSVGF